MKGCRESMERGVLAGYQMTDIAVELYDGSYHDVDSSEVAFKIASSQAMGDAMRQAKPVIMEPMMRVEVTVPDEYLGDITGDLSSKRGIVESTEDRGMIKAIRAAVPLSEMFGYMNQLRSMTSGRGSFTMEFARYDAVPRNVADDIIAKRS
jgi:elongation factor G